MSAVPATSQARAPVRAVESVEPFFFDGPRGVLYGCHHRPPAGGDRGSALLLCPPIGHEYTACHRAMRQLAAQLSKAGHQVMRFDYGGTGDSAGDPADARLAGWHDDVVAAVAACQQRTGCGSLGLAGLRVGASLALQVAAGRDDIDRLILWNPVLDGVALLKEWRAAAADFVAELGWQVPASPEQVLGLPLPPGLVADLAGIRPAVDGLDTKRVLLCHDPADAAAVSFAERLQGQVRQLDVRPIEGGAVWRKLELEAIVPAQTLQTIIQWA